MKLIDNHCHLDYPQFDADREQVISKCQQKLEAIICAGSDAGSNSRVIEMAKEYDGFIHACGGLHPTRIPEMKPGEIEGVADQIRKNCENIIAVGEIGMDYYHVSDTKGRERQERMFRMFLELATDIDLPVVIHSRDAESQVLDILASYDLKQVIMHCFNGNEDDVATAIDAGYWISVSTQVLYSNRVQMIAETTPTDQMLLETDAPFLYPGDERNVPWNVHESLEKIASLRNIAKEALAEQCNKNTKMAYTGIE